MSVSPQLPDLRDALAFGSANLRDCPRRSGSSLRRTKGRRRISRHRNPHRLGRPWLATCGAISLRSSSHFPSVLYSKVVNSVILVLVPARLEIKPPPT